MDLDFRDIYICILPLYSGFTLFAVLSLMSLLFFFFFLYWSVYFSGDANTGESVLQGNFVAKRGFGRSKSYHPALSQCSAHLLPPIRSALPSRMLKDEALWSSENLPATAWVLFVYSIFPSGSPLTLISNIFWVNSLKLTAWGSGVTQLSLVLTTSH